MKIRKNSQLRILPMIRISNYKIRNERKRDSQRKRERKREIKRDIKRTERDKD